MTKPDLLKDLVDEILCRVPATNLKRLRSTCKRWNSSFKDDCGFAREHCDKAAKEFLFLMLRSNMRICPMSVNLHGNVPSLEVKRELCLPDPHFNNSKQFDIAHVFVCDGLLLCAHPGTTRYGSKIVVWNPFTGQTRWIETGHRFPGYFVLGYCQDNKSCRSYKILSFKYLKKESTEIYDFNSDSWRRIHECISPAWSITGTGTGVSLKGNVYWLAKEASKPELGINLLSFDFSTEKLSLCVPLPYQYQDHMYESLSLSDVRGEKLTVLLKPGCTSKTEIWVTNKIDETTKVVSWNKVLALDLSPDPQSRELSFLLDEEKKFALCCDRWLDMEREVTTKDMIYIVGEDNKVTEVDFGVDTIEGVCWSAILNYVPSLVHIERAGCKRKRGE